MNRMSAHESLSDWIVRAEPRPQARMRLICLPYAGGGPQIYHTWARSLPSSVEVCAVQLPGHGKRLLQPAFNQLAPLVAALLAEAQGAFDKPFALFGHSMGGLIAFELARALRSHRGFHPAVVFASGCDAPQYPEEKPLHALPTSELLEEIRRLDGIPEEVLAHEELVELLLPTLRADLTLAETYRYSRGEPLDCPISAFAGDLDPMARPEQVRGWEEHTTSRFSLRILSGGHFFLQTRKPQLLRMIAEELEALPMPDWAAARAVAASVRPSNF